MRIILLKGITRTLPFVFVTKTRDHMSLFNLHRTSLFSCQLHFVDSLVILKRLRIKGPTIKSLGIEVIVGIISDVDEYCERVSNIHDPSHWSGVRIVSSSDLHPGLNLVSIVLGLSWS